MSNLYALAREYQEIEDDLDELDGEMGEHQPATALASKLDCVLVEGNQKFACLIAWIKNLKASIDARKEEIDKLKARNQAEENRRSALRSYMLGWLKTSNQQKFKCEIGTASIRAGSVSLEVDDSQVLAWSPDVYAAALEAGAIEEVVRVKSKTKLKELFPETYLNLPGVSETVGEETVQIR